MDGNDAIGLALGLCSVVSVAAPPTITTGLGRGAPRALRVEFDGPRKRAYRGRRPDRSHK